MAKTQFKIWSGSKTFVVINGATARLARVPIPAGVVLEFIGTNVTTQGSGVFATIGIDDPNNSVVSFTANDGWLRRGPTAIDSNFVSWFGTQSISEDNISILGTYANNSGANRTIALSGKGYIDSRFD